MLQKCSHTSKGNTDKDVHFSDVKHCSDLKKKKREREKLPVCLSIGDHSTNYGTFILRNAILIVKKNELRINLYVLT